MTQCEFIRSYVISEFRTKTCVLSVDRTIVLSFQVQSDKLALTVLHIDAAWNDDENNCTNYFEIVVEICIAKTVSSIYFNFYGLFYCG